MAPKTAPKASTLAAWKKSALHTVTLPSSAVVMIKIPDLPAIIAGGNMPQHLLDVALKVASNTGEAPTPTVDLIKEQRDFSNHLAKVTIVEPEVKDEDLDDLPVQDLIMLVEFATRARDIDAAGVHIGGLKLANEWGTFPEGNDGNEALED